MLTQATQHEPMNTFNPEVQCRVHDALHDQIIEWNPQWASLYREHGVLYDEGVIAWDGLLLDGWIPVTYHTGCRPAPSATSGLQPN